MEGKLNAEQYGNFVRQFEKFSNRMQTENKTDVIKDYNKYRKTFLKNNPSVKDIDVPKFSLQSPEKVYGKNRINKLIEEGLDLNKSYDDIGYTVDVGKKTRTLKEFITDPKNIARLKKFGKVGAGIAAGASLPSVVAADEPGAETPDDFPTGKVAAGAAVAPLATKKGRSVYGKAAKQIARGVGKTLAVGALPLEAGFVLSDLKSGASTPEALANIFLLGGAVKQKEKKDFISNKYGPEVYAQIQSYKSFGEDGMDMPQELPDQFQTIELEADQFVEDERTRRAEEFARQTEEDRSLSLMPESMTEGLYALGGRVGFAEGPKDPKRRKFIKIMGGLASLPLVGKYFKLAEPLSKAAPVATESVKLGFDKFMVLVNKIKTLGDDVTPQRSTIEREKITVYQGKDGSEYELIEDLTTGNTRVTKDKPGMATSGDKSYDTIDNRTVMEYTKGETIPGKKKGIKVADEYDEYEEVAGVDGTFDDVDDVQETIVKEIEDELK